MHILSKLQIGMRKTLVSLSLGALCVFWVPSLASACACGCSVFTVGTPWSMPIRSGFEVFFQYNFMDQSSDWSRYSGVPASLNSDLEIRTAFYTLGLQYMADRNWGVTVETPVWDRYFNTILDNGDAASVTHSSVGDVRVLGMYTGLSGDMSTGVQFGLKLPTGSFDQSLMDRDTQIGSGTTDFLLGGYQMGQEKGWGWFTQLMWQHAMNERSGYRPGDSFDISGGIHIDNILSSMGIIPTLQLAASLRGKDSGDQADPANTGYERVYVSPGIEAVLSNNLSVFANVKIPLWTHVQGVQLVAPALVGVTVSYDI